MIDLQWQWRRLKYWLKHRVHIEYVHNIDSAIARTALKHLRVYRQYKDTCPYGLDLEKWSVVLDDIIFFLECKINYDTYWEYCYHSKYEDSFLITKEEWKVNRHKLLRYQRGQKLFSKHWEDLWT